MIAMHGCHQSATYGLRAPPRFRSPDLLASAWSSFRLLRPAEIAAGTRVLRSDGLDKHRSVACQFLRSVQRRRRRWSA